MARKRCGSELRISEKGSNMPGCGEQISDAVAHQATADHANFLLCAFFHIFPRTNKQSEPR
jgi:hypothetical protein